MSKQGKKQDFEDDGRTVADMNLSGMKWYDPARKAAPANGELLQLTKAERRAMLKAALGVSLKLALLFIGVFFVVLVLLQLFWLH
ncbi:MAG: hypothetical protein RR022_01180 [Angelakisella sp.]